MNKIQNKKGFSLIELGIVIAVISLLVVGISSSSQLISFSKRMSVWRSLSQAEKAIGSFNSLFGSQGMKLGMGTYEYCKKLDDSFSDSVNNFCSAMYTKSDGTYLVPTMPIRAFMTEQLILTNYIPAGSVRLVDSTGKYLNTRVAQTITLDNITYTGKVFGGNTETSELLFGDTTKSNGGLQFVRSQVDSENVLSVGYINDGGISFGTPYTVLSNGYIGRSSTDLANKNKYLITIFSENLNQAVFTSSEMQLFDSKYDDGIMGQGNVIGGRIETSASPARTGAATDKTTIFTGNNVSSGAKAASGGMAATENGACFNLGIDTPSLTPYTAMTPTTFAANEGDYTASASKIYSTASKAGVALTNNQIQRAKNDKAYGCNVVFISSYKYSAE